MRPHAVSPLMKGAKNLRYPIGKIAERWEGEKRVELHKRDSGSFVAIAYQGEREVYREGWLSSADAWRNFKNYRGKTNR